LARVYNFGAGPSMLPEPVLERAREELLDWRGTGISMLETNHRGADFRELAQVSEAKLRRLLSIPEPYRVLFLHGPARIHYSAVPLNLLRGRTRADYADTGIWSDGAIKEGRRYCEVNVVASSRPEHYTRIPPFAQWRLDPQAAYLHITPNETIGGVEFHDWPDTGEVPLVGDFSSTILSRPVDVERFGLIYSGAQKNMGIAGLSVVIVREDLLGAADPRTPSMLDYAHQVAERSLAATAPTFAWYLADLMLDWVEAQGGVAAMAERNRRKAEKLYRFIDGSNYYANPVEPASRSWMNVPFTLAEPAEDERFLAEARAAGLAGLKGHRFVGGMRASLYNAMPEAGVDALVAFMGDFMERRP
jgi:phosphoserine aminotransferase